MSFTSATCFKIGGAVVEVTQPRVPCFKLGIKMGIDGFERRFLESLRVGFYLRVLEEGEVGAGDVFELLRPDPERMTVRELNNVGYFDTDNLREARRALRIQALSVGWRDWLEKRLMAPDKRASSTRGLRRLSVERKVRESDVIISFYLESDDGEPLLPFVPGQFLPVRLDVPGQPTPLTRMYSLSDGPADRDHYRLSIKREGAPENRSDLPPGVASSYLHNQVEQGTKLEAAPPRGKFTLDPWSELPVVLLSAGVGLTPMISMLNAIVEIGSGRPVWFIHGARSGREHALSTFAVLHSNTTTSRYTFGTAGPKRVMWKAATSTALGAWTPHSSRKCCAGATTISMSGGPTAFMKELYGGLRDRGVPETRIHYEFFGAGSALGEEDASVTSGSTVDRCTEIEVIFASSGVTANWQPTSGSILELAEAHGLSPAYSCRSGVCHTCECALEAGEVEYVEQPMVPPEEGAVLIRCWKPKTDVVLEYLSFTNRVPPAAHPTTRSEAVPSSAPHRPL